MLINFLTKVCPTATKRHTLNQNYQAQRATNIIFYLSHLIYRFIKVFIFSLFYLLYCIYHRPNFFLEEWSINSN